MRIQSRSSKCSCVARLFKVAIIAVGMIGSVGSSSSPAQAQSVFGSSDFARLHWISRVFRTLRSESKIPLASEIQKLANLPDAEIVRQAMSGPEFSETVFRFNLFFLGHSPDGYRLANRRFRQSTLDLAPSALTSAREIARDGDYAKLFDFNQPIWISELPLASPNYAQYTESLLARIDAVKPSLPATACSEINAILRGNSGIARLLPTLIKEEVYASPGWAGVETVCKNPHPAKTDLIRALKQLRLLAETFFAAAVPLATPNYTANELNQVQSLALDSLGIKTKLWTMPLGRILLNTRSNFNRKRGAYVLKHFFCENLTPVPVPAALPQPHFIPDPAEHGSDPSCRACHYRLDPMSGFFRDFGHHFLDMRARERVTLDDGFSAPRTEYQKHWFEGAILNVGYIRETPTETTPLPSSHRENLYAKDPEGLSKIFRTAPEVKQCLTQRWAEFLFGKKQIVDQEFLAGLSRQLALDWENRSTARAIQNLVQSLVLSQTFREINPDPETCYDTLPVPYPSTRAPCAIRWVLKNNCLTCHSNPEKKLDLSRWIKLPSGQYGFAHKDKAGPEGQLLSRAESFRRILDRISSANEGNQMPPRQAMPQAEKERLFEWLSQ